MTPWAIVAITCIAIVAFIAIVSLLGMRRTRLTKGLCPRCGHAAGEHGYVSCRHWEWGIARDGLREKKNCDCLLGEDEVRANLQHV